MNPVLDRASRVISFLIISVSFSHSVFISLSSVYIIFNYISVNAFFFSSGDLFCNLACFVFSFVHPSLQSHFPLLSQSTPPSLSFSRPPPSRPHPAPPALLQVSFIKSLPSGRGRDRRRAEGLSHVGYETQPDHQHGERKGGREGGRQQPGDPNPSRSVLQK